MRELSDKHRVGEHGLKGHRLFADGVKVAFLADQHGATHGIDDSEIALQKRDDLAGRGTSLLNCFESNQPNSVKCPSNSEFSKVSLEFLEFPRIPKAH